MISKLLLSPEDIKPSFPDWKVVGVLNPAAIRLPNKKIMLYARIAESPIHKNETTSICPVIVTKEEYGKTRKFENRRSLKCKSSTLYFKNKHCLLPNISHFRRIILSGNGMEVESISELPDFTGKAPTSEYGVEDPRIVKIKRNYLMTYVSVSTKNGISSSLAISRDLKKWNRKGIIFQEQNKDVVLFPEKINGKYIALNRPETSIAFRIPSIWISYSTNLIYWGRESNIMKTRRDSWESNRNGAGPPPIKTKKGWLIIYHGVNNMKNKNTYSVGAALLDLKNPEKILARSPKNNPLIKPEKKYEKSGFVNNVIFPTGIVQSKDKKHILLFSGGADSVISVQKLSLNEIFKNIKR